MPDDGPLMEWLKRKAQERFDRRFGDPGPVRNRVDSGGSAPNYNRRPGGTQETPQGSVVPPRTEQRLPMQSNRPSGGIRIPLSPAQNLAAREVQTMGTEGQSQARGSGLGGPDVASDRSSGTGGPGAITIGWGGQTGIKIGYDPNGLGGGMPFNVETGVQYKPSDKVPGTQVSFNSVLGDGPFIYASGNVASRNLTSLGEGRRDTQTREDLRVFLRGATSEEGREYDRDTPMSTLVSRFQEAYGLTPTGEIDESTATSIKDLAGAMNRMRAERPMTSEEFGLLN